MIGVDEVGRGCLAGPLLVVAARQLGDLPSGLADSKVLTRAQREQIFRLFSPAIEFGEGWVKPTEINRLGLSGAMRLGIKRALKQLVVDCSEEIVMDGPINYFSARYKKVNCLIDADATVPLVSAASIYAKVRRDTFMIELARKHPKYGFERHVGYGTRSHIEALNRFGYLKMVHRRFFSPVAALDRAESWQRLT